MQVIAPGHGAKGTGSESRRWHRPAARCPGVQGKAKLVGAPEDGLAKVALVGFLHRHIETLRKVAVCVFGNRKVTLNHYVGRQLLDYIVAINNEHQVVVFLGRQRVKVALHGTELGEMRHGSIELGGTVPAEQCWDGISVDSRRDQVVA